MPRVSFLLTRTALPPVVLNVSSGSVSLGLAGPSLVIAGVSFVIAAAGELVPGTHPPLLYGGGALLLSLGLIDLCVGWYKTINEGMKAGSEAQLSEIQAQKESRNLVASETVKPAASYLPASEVAIQCSQNGLSVSIGTQLLNQVMPPTYELNVAAGRPGMVVSSDGPDQGQKATAQA